MNRATPLSAARAAVSASWALALVAVAVLVNHPLAILSVLLVALIAAAIAGCGSDLLRAAKVALPMAILFTVLNALLSPSGLDVVARLGSYPLVGRVDVTLEGVAWGSLIALRMFAAAAISIVFAASVDQDELMALVRRRAGRFGLATVVAGRMMPLLAADGSRMAEAQRTLAMRSLSKLGLVNAIAAGATDRAADAAAALEMRGLGSSSRPGRPVRRPWSRHDIAFSASACLILVVTLLAESCGWFRFAASATLGIELGALTFLAVTLMSAIALLPFAERRGVGG